MQKITDISTAWARKYPEQVVLVITRNKEGKINLMAVGWICIVSDEPPMFLLGIDDPAYTLELIRENREFTIAYPSKAMAKEVLFAGTNHGHNIDKGKITGLAFESGKATGVPILADAVANFECRLVTEYRPGNCPLVVGEVLSSFVNTDESITRLINAGKGYVLQ